MKKIKLFVLICSLLWANSCKDFDELQIDPNRATLSHPSLLLTNLEITTFTFNNISPGAALATRMMVYTDESDDSQYYAWQRSNSDFNRYNHLRQVVKMNEEADRIGAPNYKALALFFQSVNILEITKIYGDVPYTESLAGTTQTPAYDPQSAIYLKVLNDLEEANNSLSEANGTINGDIIFNGDIQKWKQLINSYSLKVLISLSSHTGNTTLNVKNRFNKIFSDPATYPLIMSNDDNGALRFYDQSTSTSLLGNRYPLYNNNSFKTAYYMDESFVNLLKDHSDPRLFVMADKKPQGAALPDDDPDAYGGLDGSAPLAANITRLVNGEASKINPRYYTDPINEPSVLMGYAEVEFTLAEAAQRGWIAASAEEHYLNGVRASMNFYGISSSAQDDYVLETGVAFVPATAIEQIITQKYINFFLQGGWEAFFNHQRTGFPHFKVDGGGVLNNQTVPKRWMYPTDEFTLNLASAQAAIARQYPAGDNINGVMWLLQTE
ncbi:MAG TPA: SusD/RagB family nutrient-binding outer membrane lipoprotein [Cyclobacteriaceae bacterium]|nr:SusD/RagB family nutrient-binding outer membrane lipoprotein [Cyclobacteriaceae bacterium]